MAFELKDGQGSLFKNSKREKDSQPNAKGELKIGGVVYEVAAWTKKDKNGNPWQSLSVKPKGEQKQSGKKEPEALREDDDLPF